MRVVYDASAKSHSSAPLLNDCSEVGLPLQNKPWKALVREKFHPVALAGDIRKAFLLVRIHAQERDALWFHWLEAKDPQRIRTYRLTRALFGLGPSPFLLGGGIQQHVNTCRNEDPKCTEDSEIFAQANVHSNVKELKLDDVPNDNAKKLEPVAVTEHKDDLSYAKGPI